MLFDFPLTTRRPSAGCPVNILRLDGGALLLCPVVTAWENHARRSDGAPAANDDDADPSPGP